MNAMFNFISTSELATFRCAEQLGALLQSSVVLGLVGDLGAGKTHFVQGLAAGLGVKEVPVSPTFILLSEYDGRLPLLHADLYRLHTDELLPLGLEEQLETWPGVAAVEWSNRFPDQLPESHISIAISFHPKGRLIVAQSSVSQLNQILERWMQRV